MAADKCMHTNITASDLQQHAQHHVNHMRLLLVQGMKHILSRDSNRASRYNNSRQADTNIFLLYNWS
jgi:predicted ATPase